MVPKSVDPDKYVYSDYGIRFGLSLEFSLPDGSVCTDVIIFWVDTSSSVHIDNKKKDILILGFGPIQGLDDTTTSVSLHCNWSNGFSFVNATKMYQFKAEDSKIKKYS